MEYYFESNESSNKILEYEDYLDHPDVEGRRMLLGESGHGALGVCGVVGKESEVATFVAGVPGVF